MQQMRTFFVLVALCTSAICAASLHIGGTASAAPKIPKAWDEPALADWATPIAGLNVRPTNLSTKDYYSMAVENLRTYPVYFPGREPDGYWEMLQRLGPKPLIEPESSRLRRTGSRQDRESSTKPIISICVPWIRI
jgi:hypothetical protein